MARRICFFGDSFVLGYGDPTVLGWVGRVCAERAAAGQDLTSYNLGIRGATSGQIRQCWSPESQIRLASTPIPGLVFSFGANDAAQKVAITTTLDNAETILSQARLLAPTLLIGPAPIADDTDADARIAALCPTLATLALKLTVPYLPIHKTLRGNDAWMTEALAGDGAHPRAGGYTALAQLVSAWAAWQAWFPQ